MTRPTTIDGVEKAGHTPGPWAVRKVGPFERIVTTTGNSVARTIEFMPEFKAEQAANARLIAAAPELLDALLNLRHILNGNGYATDHADKAIAKALGQ